MELRCDKKGVRVAWVWICLVLVVPAVFVAWQNLWLGLAFYPAACVWACWALSGWARTLRLKRTGCELSLTQGDFISTARRLPVYSISSVAIWQTPLLRKAGCCIAMVHSASCVWLLPFFPLEDIQRLATLPAKGGQVR